MQYSNTSIRILILHYFFVLFISYEMQSSNTSIQVGDSKVETCIAIHNYVNFLILQHTYVESYMAVYVFSFHKITCFFLFCIIGSHV